MSQWKSSCHSAYDGTISSRAYSTQLDAVTRALENFDGDNIDTVWVRNPDGKVILEVTSQDQICTHFGTGRVQKYDSGRRPELCGRCRLVLRRWT